MTTGAGKCINDVSEIDAIGHRVVHGGEKFKSSCLITDEDVYKRQGYTKTLYTSFTALPGLRLEKPPRLLYNKHRNL